jgi:hypothetical protein
VLRVVLFFILASSKIWAEILITLNGNPRNLHSRPPFLSSRTTTRIGKGMVIAIDPKEWNKWLDDSFRSHKRRLAIKKCRRFILWSRK